LSKLLLYKIFSKSTKYVNDYAFQIQISDSILSYFIMCVCVLLQEFYKIKFMVEIFSNIIQLQNPLNDILIATLVDIIHSNYSLWVRSIILM